MSALQRLNVQANGAPGTQLLQQLLGATSGYQASHGSNLHQTESRLALLKQNSQEQDIQSLHELRQFLEQNKKNGNSAAEMILSQKPSPMAKQEQIKPVQAGLGQPQVAHQGHSHKIGISADSWKTIQNHVRYQPIATRNTSQITALATAAGSSTLQMPSNDVQENTIDESIQNVELLKDKVHQQLLKLGNGPTEIAQRAAQHGATRDRKDAQQFAALRPPTASSVVAAAHDPYKTPPQKKEEYEHEQ